MLKLNGVADFMRESDWNLETTSTAGRKRSSRGSRGAPFSGAGRIPQ
jgi:hypothetical protein